MLSFVRRERRPEYVQADHGLIIHQGEVGLGRPHEPERPAARVCGPARWPPSAAWCSPPSPPHNLGRHAPALPTPVARRGPRGAAARCCPAGRALVPVWEALDLAGCISRWIPAGRPIRARPQHNPMHRHTVDRHSVQTVAEAQRHLTQVDRPDILLLACLFHDIGKLPGRRHPPRRGRGADRPRGRARRSASTSADADLVELLVREHLTLAELATRRDHGDPATIDALVEAVEGRADVLDLLRCLTEADARAAGPAAWSPWRAQLINGLADQVEGMLVDERHPGRRDRSWSISGWPARSSWTASPRIRVEPQPGGLQLVIAARDRLGLFSDTAGLLASHRHPVRSAVLHTVEGVAVNTWRVDKQAAGDLPDPAYPGQAARTAGGRRHGHARRGATPRGPGAQPAAGARAARRAGAATPARAPPWSRSGPATGPGCCTPWAARSASARLSIRSAHISTLAGQAIDTFYVTEADGSTRRAARSAAGEARLPALTARQPRAADSSSAVELSRRAIRSSTSAEVGGWAPRREQTIDAAAAPRRSESSRLEPELDRAVQEAGHERVAGADGVDHLGREPGDPGHLAARLDRRAAARAEGDHRQAEAVLLDPAGRRPRSDRRLGRRAPSAWARNLMSSSLALTMPLAPPDRPQPRLDLGPVLLRVGDHRRPDVDVVRDPGLARRASSPAAPPRPG